MDMPPTSDGSRRSRGLIQRWSQTLIPTMREAPADSETPSHVLLSRAGFIRPVGGAGGGGAGIYDYLPLAWRTLQKISEIVREEMNAAGASEMLMPAMEPIELFADTKRDVDYGDNLFKLKDRKDRTIALAPTHEEIITELMKGSITSYKQLPLNLYQIQTKFRDEARPRAGLLRCREFIMKDAYSFHITVEGAGGLNKAYDAMHQAYTNIFTRCGLDFSAVEAESGPIGGSASHEFMVNCESGEDTILYCPASGYAANVEKCEIGERAWSWDSAAGGTPAPPQALPLEKKHTPGLPGIDVVAGVLGATAGTMLKTLVYRVGSSALRAEGRLPTRGGHGDAGMHTSARSADLPYEWVLAVVRGDHDVNEGKVRDATGLKIAMADEKEAKDAGFAIGYVSPRASLDEKFQGSGGLCKALVVVDPDAARGDVEWATGADEVDYHVKHFHWRREMGAALEDPRRVRVADIRNAQAGDPSPRAKGSKLEARRGIEVGHIFKLGTKYSEAMGFNVLDKEQKKRTVIMGCYGIGVSRTMAACVEMSHDGDGIIWPMAIAPFNVVITLMKPDNAEHMSHAQRLAGELADAGLDVLIDDRDERPGVKFKDADLIGIPLRLTVGEKALAEGSVEFKRRGEAGKGDLVKLEQVVARCRALEG